MPKPTYIVRWFDHPITVKHTAFDYLNDAKEWAELHHGLIYVLVPQS